MVRTEVYLPPPVTTRGRLGRAIALVVVVLAAALTPAARAVEGDLDRSFAGDGRLALPGGATAWFDLPAAAIIGGLTLLLVRGNRQSTRVNIAMVATKVAIIVSFVAVGPVPLVIDSKPMTSALKVKPATCRATLTPSTRT